MSYQNAMSIDYVPSKRRLSPSDSDLSTIALHQGKRYKAESSSAEYSGAFSVPTEGETKHHPKQLITIPSKVEIYETVRKEQYVQHMMAMMKREKANYLIQLKGYNMPHCGTLIGEKYECEEMPKLTSKKE